MDWTSIRTMRFLFFGLVWWAASSCSQRARPSSAACWWPWPRSGSCCSCRCSVGCSHRLQSARHERPSRRWTSDAAAPGRYGARCRRDRDRRCTRCVSACGRRRPLDLRARSRRGVSSDRVVDGVAFDANTKVGRAVADGRIAPDRASMLRTRLPNWPNNSSCKRRKCSLETDRYASRSRQVLNMARVWHRAPR